MPRPTKGNNQPSRAPTPNFLVGGMVWLLRRNITTTHPCAKLDQILWPIGSTFLTTITSMNFSCISLGGLPSLYNSRSETGSTTAHRVGVWKWVWSWRNTRLQAFTSKTLFFGLLERIPDIWSYLGTSPPFDECSRSNSWFPSSLSTQACTT